MLVPQSGLAGTPTAAAGDIVYFQHGASQGAASDDGTTAQAAVVQANYELL